MPDYLWLVLGVSVAVDNHDSQRSLMHYVRNWFLDAVADSPADLARDAPGNAQRNGLTDARDERFAKCILIIAVAANLLMLLTVFSGIGFMAGDATSHMALIEYSVRAFRAGFGVYGNWCPWWNAGFPYFHYYQSFAHIFVGLLHMLLWFISLESLFRAVTLLVIISIPVSFFYCAKTLGFGSRVAALSSLVSLALSSSIGFGIELSAYLGWGLWCEMFGLMLLPIALARIYKAVREGRGFFLPVLLLSILLGTHIVSGYVAILSAALFALMSVKDMKRTAVRLGFIIVPALIAVSFFAYPMLSSRAYYADVFYDTEELRGSFGVNKVLLDFVSGNILDAGRAPYLVFTALCIAGLFVGREKKYRYAYFGFFFWLLMYFGRESVLGPLISLIPGSSSLPFYRLIIGLHMFCIFFCAIALDRLYAYVEGLIPGRGRYAAALLLFIIIFPVFMFNITMVSRRAASIEGAVDLDGLWDMGSRFKALPPGRVLANHKTGIEPVQISSLIPLYLGHDSMTSVAIGTAESLSFFYTFAFDEHNPDHYRLFATNYVIAATGHDLSDVGGLLWKSGKHGVYKVGDFGYVDLVDARYAVAGDMDIIRTVGALWMGSRALSYGQYLALSIEDGQDTAGFEMLDGGNISAVLDELPASGPCGDVQAEGSGFNWYSAEVSANRGCFALLKVTYNPNWHAYVDGVETDPVMLTPSFIGVRVEPGEHEIVWRYYEDGTRRYLWIIGVIALAVVFLYDFRDRFF